MMDRKARKFLRKALVAFALERGETKAQAEKTADAQMKLAVRAHAELPADPLVRVAAIRGAVHETGIAWHMPDEHANEVASNVASAVFRAACKR